MPPYHRRQVVEVVPWGTDTELRFMRTIGTHSAISERIKRDPAPEARRLDLLRLYLQGLRRRSVWGKIERGRVIRDTEDRIRALEQIVAQAK